MKRIFVVAILLIAGTALFAQQSTAQGNSRRPSSAQVKDNARQYLNQGKSNASQFDSSQANLNARNVSNDDAHRFNQLKDEIDKLESTIREEQNRISATLEKGIKVNKETLDRVQKLIERHKEKLAELESFTAG